MKENSVYCYRPNTMGGGFIPKFVTAAAALDDKYSTRFKRA